MFSRTATGFTEASSTEPETSDFAALTTSVLGGFAADLGPPDEGLLPLKSEVGRAAGPVLPGAPLEAAVLPEAGFSAALPAGLVVPIVAALSTGLEGGFEPGDEPVAGIVADAAGLAAEFVDGAGLEVCACLGDGAAAEGAFAPAAGFAGVAGFNALRTASGVAGICCAIDGVASDAKPKTISQLASFRFRMFLY